MANNNYDVGNQLPVELRNKLNTAVDVDAAHAEINSSEPELVLSNTGTVSRYKRTSILSAVEEADVVTLPDGTFLGQRKSCTLIGLLGIGTLQCVSFALTADGDYFTIDDGVNAAVLFEFDKTGNGVTSGRTSIDISTGGITSAANVAAVVIPVINGLGASVLNVTATAGATGLINLVNNNYAASQETITENVTNAGFTVSAFATDEGTVVLTPTHAAAGYTTVTLSAAFDGCELEWTTLGWVIVSITGTASIT